MPYTLSIGGQHQTPQAYLTLRTREQAAHWALRIMVLFESAEIVGAVLLIRWDAEDLRVN